MDHFNATVKDGKLVKTRRGLQVSRQRFNGLSFVNASPQEGVFEAGPSSGVAGAPSPGQHTIRFVDEESESGRETPDTQGRDAEQQDVSGAGQGPKRRRRGARRGKSLERSRPATPSRASPAPFEERTFQLDHPASSTDMPRLDPNLATEASAGFPPEPNSPISEHDWALFDRYFDSIPRSMYPCEDILAYNPARVPEFYAMVRGDAAAFHCVLMCGSIVEAVASGAEPRDLAYHISKICAILNQKLDRDHAADAVTLHCIATLAWVGCYVGRLDHWHLHMCGLKKVLDLNGGMAGLPEWLVAEMYKADLNGATVLASTPYLPFNRQYTSVSTSIPPDVCQQIPDTISAMLNPLTINPNLITTLTSLALLASATHLARQSQSHGTVTGPITLDPQAFTTEWQTLMHALLTHPSPLREPPSDFHAAINPYSTPSTNDDDDPASQTESYISDHRLLPSVQITPATTGSSDASGALESALRIAALLYLKELLPEYPRNLGGYAVLLALLRWQLREIIRLHGGVGSTSSDRHAAGTGGEGDGRDSAGQKQERRDIEGDRTGTGTGTGMGEVEGEGATPDLANLKPVVIFLALIGDTISQRADIHECRVAPGDCYPRGIYRDILREVAGLADEKGVASLGEGDLRMVRVFELGVVLTAAAGNSGGSGSGIQRGQSEDEYVMRALREIVAGGQGGML